MTWVAVAVVGGSVVGGAIASQGAQNAAQTQANAARDAQSQLIATGQKASQVYQPYVGSGGTALGYLNYGMGQPTQFGQTTRPAAVPAGYSLTAPEQALTVDENGVPVAGMYSQEMPPEGQQFAYNQQTGERITIPITETIGVDGAAPGFEQGYFTRQFNARDLYNNLDPGYQFRLRQGQMANQQAANTTGGMVGGNALKSLQDYTQNFASGEYANAFGRFNAQRTNIYNQLSDIAKIGMTGAQGQANTQIGTGTNVASITSGLGNAQAASQISQGNILGNVANTAGQMGAYSLMNKNPASSPTSSNLASLNWQAPSTTPTNYNNMGGSGIGIGGFAPA
jgi:hypothetical protein